MRRMFASLVVALFVVGVASACINDSEFPGHEREFRSNYKNQSPPDERPPYLPENATQLALFGGGGLLLGGAGLIAVRKVSTMG
jgi:hypothetical protein